MYLFCHRVIAIVGYLYQTLFLRLGSDTPIFRIPPVV